MNISKFNVSVKSHESYSFVLITKIVFCNKLINIKHEIVLNQNLNPNERR